MIDPGTVTAVISFATRLIEIGNRAIDAANNGDLDKAKEYLEQSREHFDNSVADWKAAGDEQ